MSDMAVLTATKRTKIGTGAARELRNKGMVPAIVYGVGKESLSIFIEEKEATKLYRKHGFTSTVVGIEIDGKVHKVLPKAVQLHPITDIVNHIDFVFLNKDTQNVDVPIVFEGKERAIGVKRGGFFNIILRKLTVNCPVDSVPQDIKIDVSNMGIGSSILASNLPLPKGCSLVNKSKLVVASITGRGGKSDNEASNNPGGDAAA